MIPLLVPIGLGLLGGYLSKDSTQKYAGGGGVDKKSDEYWERRENLERFLNYTDENIYWKWVNGELTDLMAVQLVEEIHGEKFNPTKKYADGGGVAYFNGGKIRRDIYENKIITEGQILALKRALNNDNPDAEDVLEYIHENPPRLEESQNKKGYDYLMKQYKTSTGKVKDNSPFGNREKGILDNFSHFELITFNSGFPVYAVISKDGNRFEYYFDGKVNIVG